MGISDLAIGAPRYCYSTQDYNEVCRERYAPSQEEVAAKEAAKKAKEAAEEAKRAAFNEALSKYYEDIRDIPLNLKPINQVLTKYKRKHWTSGVRSGIKNPCKPTKIKNRWYICDDRWKIFLERGLDENFCCYDPRAGHSTM